jgi:hypothetical protein
MEETETPAVADTTAPRDATSELIDRWFADHFHGSIVARNADVYNHVHAATQDLKRRLRSI